MSNAIQLVHPAAAQAAPRPRFAPGGARLITSVHLGRTLRKMRDHWNSLDWLSAFSFWMQTSIVVFGVLTAIALALSIAASRRIEALQAQEAQILRQELAEARSAAQAAHDQANQIAERHSPRSLTESESRRLASLLSSVKGTVAITAVLGDGESFSFAKQLEAVLIEAGWNVTGVGKAVFSGQPKGVLLKVQSQDDAPSFAGHLQQALSEIGIEAIGLVDSGVEPNKVEIVVGEKPDA